MFCVTKRSCAMAATVEKVLSEKNLADRKSAIKTIDTEIEAISRLKDSVAFED